MSIREKLTDYLAGIHKVTPELADAMVPPMTDFDDDPRVFLDAGDTRAGDGLFVLGNRLRTVGDQLLRHGNRATVTAQQQAIGFEGGEVFADGHFGGGEGFGQLIDAHLAMLGEQGKNGVATLRCVALRHA